MLRSLAEKIWWKVPYFFRIRIIRSAQKKFTVSVVGIVTNEKSEVLVLDHFFRPRYNWGLPGGFLDPSEKPEGAIRRELREETGLELDKVRMLNVRTIGKHIEILFRANGIGDARVKSSEIRRLGWFSLDNLPDMSEVQIHILDHVLGEGDKSE